MTRVVLLRCRDTATGAAPSAALCGRAAVTLVLTDGGEPTLSALPVCEEHAFLQAGELGHTAADEDYLILQLPAFGVGALS